MTYREGTVGGALHKRMVDNGLFDRQADAILDDIKKEGQGNPIASILHKQVEGYPKQLLAVAWMTAKISALKWIDENKPQHWARGMFEA